MESNQDWTQNKEAYREFCLRQKNLPLFHNDWWLDAVCEKGKWDVCLVRNKAGVIQAVFPICFQYKMGFCLIGMPSLTPHLGPWISDSMKINKTESKGRHQKMLLNKLIGKMPQTAYSSQQFLPDFRNALPFLWNNFKLTTRFTYILRYQNDLDQVFQGLKSSVRTWIRKAEKEITLSSSNDLELFYQLQSQTFARQGLKVPFGFDFLQRIDMALSSRNQRKVLIAKDKEGEIHAGIYLCWDSNKVYNLLQGADPKFTSSGAIKLLLWEGIQLAHQQKKDFDFEGGMMPNIESVFAAFGAELVPYYKIYKGGNWFFRLLASIKNG